MGRVNDFQPQAPRYDIMEAVADGNFASSGLAAGTTSIMCGFPSGLILSTPVVTYRKAYVRQCSFASQAVIVAATSATMQFYRQTANGATRVNLTNAVNVLAAGGLAAMTTFYVPLITGLTDAQRTLAVGDVLMVDLVIVGAVSVQFGANAACFELECIN